MALVFLVFMFVPGNLFADEGTEALLGTTVLQRDAANLIREVETTASGGSCISDIRRDPTVKICVMVILNKEIDFVGCHDFGQQKQALSDGEIAELFLFAIDKLCIPRITGIRL